MLGLESEVMRGLGSNFFHVIKPLMPILPLLPILSIHKKTDCMDVTVLHFGTV